MDSKMASKFQAVCDADSKTGYPIFESMIKDRVSRAKVDRTFRTNAAPLWGAFLSNLPEDSRQVYNCRCCERFIETFGGLVVVNTQGQRSPMFWDKTLVNEVSRKCPYFYDAVKTLQEIVSKAKITGVAVWGPEDWGTTKTGEWTHLGGRPEKCRNTNGVSSLSQIEAEKKEEYNMLCRGLSEYKLETFSEAMRVLETDTLPGSEKAKQMSVWLHDLKTVRQNFNRANGDDEAFTWVAVASAPAGWCHVKSCMIGTLLDDIQSGNYDFEEIKHRWMAKMHPTAYRRAKAPPKEGAIKRAEELFASMNLAPALQRRFARLDDVLIQFMWKPKTNAIQAASEAQGNLFGHLRSKGKAQVKSLEIEAGVMTWAKFRDKILPNASEIEYMTTTRPTAYYGLVTAVNKDAPPIVQWDGLDYCSPNPFTWYFYDKGSTAYQWGLSANEWVKVNGIFSAPPHWYFPDKFKHEVEGVFFALEGARDGKYTKGGGLFAENLRKELHEVRSVMEAFIAEATIQGKDEGNANGICIQNHGQSRKFGYGHKFRVRTRDGGLTTYTIDRWD